MKSASGRSRAVGSGPSGRLPPVSAAPPDRRSRPLAALACLLLLGAAGTLSACGVFGGETTTVVETSATAPTTTPATAPATTTAAQATTAPTTTTVPSTVPTTTTSAAPATTSETATIETTQTAVTAAPTEPSVAAGPEASAAGTTVPPAAAVSPRVGMSLDGAVGIPQFFADSSPWNRSVESDPIDARSHDLIKLARLRTAAIEEPDGTLRPIRRKVRVGLTVNVRRWTVPLFSDRGGVDTPAICRQADCGPDQVDSIVIPPDATPDPRFDGWMTVIDQAAGVARDFWRARRENDGSISYHFVKAWALDGPGFQAPGEVSARGSGLPLFAGLIRPEEIRAGRIDHALAISVPGPARLKYVQPASRTDGNGSLRSLPEGARLRLEPGQAKRLTKTFVRTARERRVAKTIIDALERYGAIVVDRSAAPTMYAQRNADWRGVLPLNLLQDIGLGRFEVVDLPKLRDVTRDTVGSGFTGAGLPTDSAPSIPATGSGTDAAAIGPATTTTTPATTTTTTTPTTGTTP